MWLLRIFHDFDAIHAGHPLDGNESEDDLPLRIGSNPGEVSVQESALPTCLLKDVEVPQQGHSVAINVKDTAAKTTHPRVAVSVVTFTEFQG